METIYRNILVSHVSHVDFSCHCDPGVLAHVALLPFSYWGKGTKMGRLLLSSWAFEGESKREILWGENEQG